MNSAATATTTYSSHYDFVVGEVKVEGVGITISIGEGYTQGKRREPLAVGPRPCCVGDRSVESVLHCIGEREKQQVLTVSA